MQMPVFCTVFCTVFIRGEVDAGGKGVVCGGYMPVSE